MKRILAWTLLLAMLSACLFTGTVSAEDTTSGITVSSVKLAENFDNPKAFNDLNWSEYGNSTDGRKDLILPTANWKFQVTTDSASFSTETKASGTQSWSSGASSVFWISPKTNPSGDFRLSANLFVEDGSGSSIQLACASIISLQLNNNNQVTTRLPHNGDTSNNMKSIGITYPKNEWITFTMTVSRGMKQAVITITKADSEVLYSDLITLPNNNAGSSLNTIAFVGAYAYVDDVVVETITVTADTESTLADLVKDENAPAVSTITPYVAPATITPSVTAGSAATVTPIGGWTEGSNTFNVASETPCIVLVSNDSGTTYTKLTGTESAKAIGGYDFTTEMTASTTLTVVPAGDADGDGTLGDSDITALTNAFLTGTASALTKIVGDSNGDGKITLVDIVYRIAQKNNLVTPTW